MNETKDLHEQTKMECAMWLQRHRAELFIGNFMKNMGTERIQVSFENLYQDITIELVWVDVKNKQETPILLLEPQSSTELLTSEGHRFSLRLAGREEAVLRTIIVSKFDIALRAYIAHERGTEKSFTSYDIEPDVIYDPNADVKIHFDVTNELDIMITLWIVVTQYTPVRIATIRSGETMPFEGHEKYNYIATAFRPFSIHHDDDEPIEVLDELVLNLTDYVIKPGRVSWIISDDLH